jgi:hypothetical protein
MVETHIENIQNCIGQLEVNGAKLLVRPMRVEEFGELRCTLAQLQERIGDMDRKKRRESEASFVQKKQNEMALQVSCFGKMEVNFRSR